MPIGGAHRPRTSSPLARPPITLGTNSLPRAPLASTSSAAKNSSLKAVHGPVCKVPQQEEAPKESARRISPRSDRSDEAPTGGAQPSARDSHRPSSPRRTVSARGAASPRASSRPPSPRPTAVRMPSPRKMTATTSRPPSPRAGGSARATSPRPLSSNRGGPALSRRATTEEALDHAHALIALDEEVNGCRGDRSNHARPSICDCKRLFTCSLLPCAYSGRHPSGAAQQHGDQADGCRGGGTPEPEVSEHAHPNLRAPRGSLCVPFS